MLRIALTPGSWVGSDTAATGSQTTALMTRLEAATPTGGTPVKPRLAIRTATA